MNKVHLVVSPSLSEVLFCGRLRAPTTIVMAAKRRRIWDNLPAAERCQHCDAMLARLRAL